MGQLAIEQRQDEAIELRRFGDAAMQQRVVVHRVGLVEARQVAGEAIELERERRIKEADYVPNYDMVEGLYETAYRGKKLLTYRGSKNYFRSYDFS